MNCVCGHSLDDTPAGDACPECGRSPDAVARDRERRRSMTLWPTVAAITIACAGVTAVANFLLYQFGGSHTWRRAAVSCMMIWLAFAAASVIFGVPVALRYARQPAPYVVIALLSMCLGLLGAGINAFAWLVVTMP